MKEKYDNELLNDLKKYNQKRKLSFQKMLLTGEVFEFNKDYERILKARYNKCSRIKKRMVYLFYRYKYIWFVTFTFDDDLISKCDRTKRDTIKKCLNNYDFKYILNKDYGKETEREHYHCILATNQNINIDDFMKENYPCFSWSKKCRKDIDNINRLHKYINKLTNHALKDTTIRERVLYNFKGFDGLGLNSHEEWIVFKRCYLDLLDKVM